MNSAAFLLQNSSFEIYNTKRRCEKGRDLRLRCASWKRHGGADSDEELYEASVIFNHFPELSMENARDLWNLPLISSISLLKLQ